MIANKTDDQKAAHKAQKAVWVQANVAPVVSQIALYASATGRGNPPEARKFLRHHAGAADVIALRTLSVMAAGAVRNDSLTTLAGNVGRGVAKALGTALEDDGKALQVGMALVSIVCAATGAGRIVDRHGDRPEKKDGGVALAPSYELHWTKGQFLADCVKFGAAGMPTYSKDGAAAWTSQEAGGVPAQAEHGMVHSAARAMKGCTADTAPTLYDAVNTAQQARFRINRGTRDVFADYDQAAARAWLLAHLMGQGMSEADAQRAAREAARL